ncbi:hypothetical protein AWZ03_010832 [Drosophila navojoa]|uniref:VM domain-containing protein n=1 Tax=Drosophila navojoa TaxID=7232 RepID=A0A484B1Q1_DRONA|nr:vitelline membrane protein Vm34Ca [Drosophila navojoa]TDG42726.1 hypothetical protein AWZ03_010832 [Drosophila navojoa]
MKFFVFAAIACLLATSVVGAEKEEKMLSSAYGGGYGQPAAAPAPQGYGAPAAPAAPSYSANAAPAQAAPVSIPAPPCPKNYLFSCQPNLAPVPCSAPAPSYGSAGAYTQYAPIYAPRPLRW